MPNNKWHPIDEEPDENGDYIIAVWRLRKDGQQDQRQTQPFFRIALFEKKIGSRNDWFYQLPFHPCPWGYKISHWAEIPQFNITLIKLEEIGRSPTARAAAIAAGIAAFRTSK